MVEIHPKRGILVAPPSIEGALHLLEIRRGRRLPAASGRRSVDHAQHRADRELATDLEPRVEVLPRPTVHPDFASLAALSAADKRAAARTVEVPLLERERFADSQTGVPEQDDKRAESMAVGAGGSPLFPAEVDHDDRDSRNRRSTDGRCGLLRSLRDRQLAE
jgi:hypothetical protein